MVMSNSGQQSARRLPWAVPAYEKQEGTNPQRRMGRLDLLNEGRKKPDVHTNLRFATWNIGSLVGRGTEIAMELVKRKVSLCCIQEARWKGNGAKFIGAKGNRYKFLWSGGDGTHGVGILIAENLCDNMIEVRRIDERIISVVLLYGKQLIRIISVYALQSGRNEEEKDLFYENLVMETELVGAKEFLIVAGDFNGHIGASPEGFEGIHGGFGMGRRNNGGRRLLEYCTETKLVVANTWFKNAKKATFRSAGAETEIDFMLVQKNWRKKIKNVNVIPGELQHSLVVMDVNNLTRKRRKNTSNIIRTKTWRLKDEQVKGMFQERMNEIYQESSESDIWLKYRDSALKAAAEACGIIRGRPQQGETWWWRQDVQDAVKRKKVSGNGRKSHLKRTKSFT